MTTFMHLQQKRLRLLPALSKICSWCLVKGFKIQPLPQKKQLTIPTNGRSPSIKLGKICAARVLEFFQKAGLLGFQLRASNYCIFSLLLFRTGEKFARTLLIFPLSQKFALFRTTLMFTTHCPNHFNVDYPILGNKTMNTFLNSTPPKIELQEDPRP